MTDEISNAPTAYREVRFEYSAQFPRVLEELHASLLVSTYQAGKLAVVGTHQGQLKFSFHNFERVMGLAVSPRRIAVGARRQVYFLHASHQLAPGIDPPGMHDACWLTRSSFVTGNVHGHDLAWGHDGLWVVNTLFSCLCTLNEDYSFVPRWRPPFISALIGQDRCHLNGVAMRNGRPAYVTAMAESDEPAGWRPTKATSGCVIDVATGETIARGFAMPHSPRLYDGRLWVLDSGTGQLVLVDPQTGKWQTVERFPGYTRGLSFCGPYAFVGLSRIRETSVFGGIPIAEHRDALRCGVAVVDLRIGRSVAALQFHSGVEEIFAVETVADCRCPTVRGASTEEDDQQEIWVVPPPETERLENAGQPQSGATVIVSSAVPAASRDSARQDALPPSRPVPSPDALARAATALQEQGRAAEALERLNLATSLAPDRADLQSDLGNAYQSVGDQQTALACYRRAVAIRPDFAPAHQNLGYLLFNHGEPEQALEHYEQAERFAPQPINRLLSATVLPVVYDSAEDVQRWRQRLAARVQSLAEEGVQVDTASTLAPTNFFLAYQGENDRHIAGNLGRIYHGLNLVGQRDASQNIADGRRIKIGFLSAYFRDHTIGRLNLGRVRHLSRERFEVTVISVGSHQDPMARGFEQAADRYVVLPRRVDVARRQIADLGLDLLLFTDVGMDALTHTLAFSRMAPVQCATWGHPDTTGSPAIDYFLSSKLLEVDGADQHYTERLVRLSTLGTHYERPELSGPPRSREFFGLDPARHIYLCPQTLFKFHPDFDAILAGILEEDPQGDVVLIEGRVANWTERLRRRFARTLPDAEHRVRFLPPQPQPDFLQLLSLADVVVDPIHFGGGNTSYEALAVGTPIVTWPGRYLRSRITLALYRKMGLTDCVADSGAEYIQLATRLGTDPAYRESLRQQIERRSHVLFEDRGELAPFEAFFEAAVAGGAGRGDWIVPHKPRQAAEDESDGPPSVAPPRAVAKELVASN